MWKAMYKLALRLIHRFVVVEQINGQVLQGILLGATKKGIFLQPVAHMQPISYSRQIMHVNTAELTPTDQLDANPVFYSPLFIPFAMVASFAAGSVLGAIVSRPPYPYGAGYPNGYPGGYPNGYPNFW